jgi:hypothetical protein
MHTFWRQSSMSRAEFVRNWTEVALRKAAARGLASGSGGRASSDALPHVACCTFLVQRRALRRGRIWYEALRDPALRTDSGFAAFARLTVIAAERLQGQGSAVASAVKNAWDNVGVPTEQPALQSLTAR